MRSRDDDAADRFVGELKALGPEAEDFVRTLVVVDTFRMWEDCPHDACRRAGRCRGEDMVCFEERRGELKRRILAQVVLFLSTARVSSDEFYDYLDEITEEEGDEAER